MAAKLDSGSYGTFHLSCESTLINNDKKSIFLQSTPNVDIHRQAYTQITLESTPPGAKPNYKQSPIEKTITKVKAYNCTPSCFPDLVKRIFPIFDWLPKYEWKQWIIWDIFAGITLSILHVPQGLAYAHLANVPAVNGLYTSFYPVLVYLLMGTSRHVSIGTFAVTSLLTSKAINTVLHHDQSYHYPIESDNRTLFVHDEYPFSNIQIGVVVAFAVGIIQFLMGVFRLGFLAIYLSEEMVSAFVMGAAIHVFTSQLKGLSGMELKTFTGPFNIIKTTYTFLTQLETVNYVVIGLSLSAIVFLVFVKEFVNPRIKKWLKFPLPVELLLVILGTLISYFLQLSTEYDVRTVGELPVGLSSPEIPSLSLIPLVLPSSVVLAAVSIALSLSLVIIYAKEHNYEVDMNQELVAYGSANVVSSFFGCIPSCVSLSRSALQEGTGGKTQLTSLFSSGIVLVVLLAMGPLFKELPHCILSVVIVVSLKSMFSQVIMLKKTWFISKLDASVWLVTFLAVVFIDMDYGLVIGVVFSLITVLYKTQIPEVCLLGNLPDTEIYRNINKYPAATEELGIKICHFGGAIYFANKDAFKTEIYDLTGVNPKNLIKEKARGRPIFTEFSKHPPFRFIILSCAAVSYIDATGSAAFLDLVTEYKQCGIEILFAGIQEPVLERLEAQLFFERVERNYLFLTIHDAVVYAKTYLSGNALRKPS